MDVDGRIASFPNGLRLKLHPNRMSKQLIYDAASGIVDPPVPMFYSEDLGREEPNPENPEYIAALKDTENRRAWASIKALLVLGTSIEQLPPDTDGPDQTDWDMVASLRGWQRSRIPDDKYSRYEAWLRYFGLLGAGNELVEFVALVRWLFIAAGMTAEAAAQIVATFRDGEGRPAAGAGGAVAANADGHVNPAAAISGT